MPQRSRSSGYATHASCVMLVSRLRVLYAYTVLGCHAMRVSADNAPVSKGLMAVTGVIGAVYYTVSRSTCQRWCVCVCV